MKVKKLRKNAKMPYRATAGSAGYDLFACIDTPKVINPGKIVMIPTGLAIQLEEERCGGFIFARSSLGAKYGIVPANCVGVIDSDYRGEVMVALTNLSDAPYTVNPNDRIAQLVVMAVGQPVITEVEELDSTDRGDGGFGSTKR